MDNHIFASEMLTTHYKDMKNTSDSGEPGEMLEYIHHNEVQRSSSAYPKPGEIPFRNIFLVKLSDSDI